MLESKHVGSTIEDATWNVVQEATSVLCCCATVYKSMLQELQVFWKQVLSLFTLSGKQNSQNTQNPFFRNLPTDGHAGRDRDWLPLAGSSQRRLIETGEDNGLKDKHSGYAMKTVAIDQRVEMV